MRFLEKSVLSAAVLLLAAALAAQGPNDSLRPDYLANIREKAEKGDAAAQLRLGLCHYKGEHVRRDLPEALKWFLKAAEGGDAEAQFVLGNFYAEQAASDPGLNPEVLRWWRKAAAQGWLDAVFALGSALFSADYGEWDYLESERLLGEAADRKHPRAKALLAQVRRVVQDKPIYPRWDKYGARQKQGAQNPVLSPPPNISALKAKSLMGDKAARYELGVVFFQGVHAEKNEAEGLSLIESSAEYGHLPAQEWLCRHYRDCHEEEPLQKWAQKAVDAGSCDIMLFMADEHIRRKNYTEAVRYLRMAAEKGMAEAQYILGGVFEKGELFYPDSREAVRWYRKAAGQSHPLAQAALASCLENGRGADKSLADAALWYWKSASQGNRSAKRALAAVEKKIKNEKK